MRRTLGSGLMLGLLIAGAFAASAAAQTPTVPPNTCGQKETFYWFVYNTNQVDTGCATKNDVVTPLAPRLHVSCSDRFPGGIPEKSDLAGKTVKYFFISKEGGKKTCGTLPPPPPDLKVKKSASSTYVTEGDTVTFRVSVENVGSGPAPNVVLTDVLAGGFQFVSASPGCTFNPANATVTCQVGDLQGGGSANPTANPCDDKQTYFKFQYNDGRIDQGCFKKNDVTRNDIPGLIANELHISCSDTFTNGIPKKSDLGDPNLRVAAYRIIKGGGKKTCGFGTFTPIKKSFEIVVKAKSSACNKAKATTDGQTRFSNQVCVKVKRKPVPLFLGYADTFRPNGGFPSPWRGSPNTTFVGCGVLAGLTLPTTVATTWGGPKPFQKCTSLTAPVDAGALRFDAPADGAPVTIRGVFV